MNMVKLYLIPLLVVTVITSCSGEPPATLIKRPNIIHIFADDLGYGEVGFNGSSIIKTPNLDALAENGLRFTSAYATAPMCAPSRAGLISGFHTGHAYVDRNMNIPIGLRRGDPTVGTVLKNAGYLTAIFGKWGFGGTEGERGPRRSLLDSLHRNPTIRSTDSLPRNQGYDYFYGYLNHNRAHSYFVDSLWKDNVYKDEGIKLEPTGNSIQQGRVNYSHQLIAQNSKQFIEENANAEKPFYMQVNYLIPHASWRDIKYVSGALDQYSDTALTNVARRTAAMITLMDKSIGDLIVSLKDPNSDGDTTDSVLSNTLIIFTSDNGAAFDRRMVPLTSNGQYRGGKFDLYEGGIRVPMLVYWVDDNGKSRINTGISKIATDLADFFPTAVDFAKTIGPVGTDGVSIAPTITGDGVQKLRKYLYFENNEAGRHGRPGTKPQKIWHKWAILDTQSQLKLIYWEGEKGTIKENQSGYELYDLENDPSETNNLLMPVNNWVNKSKRIVEIKNKLILVAKSEGAGKEDEYAVSYREWTGDDRTDVSDARNWLDGSAPEKNWSLTILNKSKMNQTAFINNDMEVLGIDVLGRNFKQNVVIASGAVLTGINEIRVSKNGHIHIDKGVLRSGRWLNNSVGGVISGAGVIHTDVYNDGILRADYKYAKVRKKKEGALHNKYDSGLFIDGDYIQSASADVIIQIDKNEKVGPSQKIFNKIKISGEAKIRGGRLIVKLADDFIPAIGNRFTIFEVGKISGKFDTVVLPELDAGKGWSIEKFYGKGEISIVEEY